jgi:signal transduction histidine kinase/ligand-binding sensor domain-containing protein
MKTYFRRHRSWSHLAFALVICAGAAICPAGNSAWSTRVWLLEDGLPSNDVVGIAQAPDGYLWIATSAGLVRFDGIHFENCDLNNLPGLHDVVITCLRLCHDGSVCVGTAAGPVIYLKPNTPPRVISENMPKSEVYSIEEDNKGTLWVGYNDSDIRRIQNGVATNPILPAELPKGARVPLALDSHGQVWVARQTHIGVIRGGHYVEVKNLADLRPGPNLASAGDGSVWLSEAQAIYRCTAPGDVKLFGSLPVTLPERRRAIPFEDRYGTLWVCTSTVGLFRYNGSEFEKVPTPQPHINCLADDREGNLWVGTSAGLDRLQPQAIEVENPNPSVALGAIASMCQDISGQIWATTSDLKVITRQGNRWVPTPFTMTDSAHCVAADPTGGIWIGTGNRARLRHWHNGQLTMMQTKTTAGSPANYISTMLVSRRGDLWMGLGSPDHLQCLRDGNFIELPLPAKEPRIRAIVEDHSGNIWLGCASGSLMRVDPADHVTDESSLVSNKAIHSLYVTPDNSLWIGFVGGGLGRLEDGHLTIVTKSLGLYEDAISQIISDDRGWLWLGGDHGISKIRLHELDDLANGKIERIQSFRYGENQELPRLQAMHSCPGAIRTPDGLLWMPMEQHLAVVHPDRVLEHPDPPPVYVSRVVTDDKVLPASSALTVTPDYRRLEVDFTALSLSAPENTWFRYRLEGFDDDWTDTTESRAIYPRLPAGDYHFRVLACNGDGVWNEQGALVQITVPPFLTQTWWFRSLALTVFSALLLLLARYISFRRLRQRLVILEQRAALDRERARIARDIHDDLGCGLTNIVMLSELSTRDHVAIDEIGGNIRQIASTAKQGIKSLDETVWAINPRNDTVPDLIDYISHFTKESLRVAGILCHLNLPDDPPELIIVSEVRHGLFLVVKEAVNNILRHSHARQAWLNITITGDAMAIEIADDGKGFSSVPDDPCQDGLRNMKQRMQDIGGLCHLESSPGKGTRVTLSYPWPASMRVVH